MEKKDLETAEAKKPALKRRRRRRSKSPGKKYFTGIHEQAIIDYAAASSAEEKERIYNELIQPVFQEMVEKIVYTYRFVTIPNIEELKVECQSDLVSVLCKYKKSKGAAFSYFTVVTKNWFHHKRKKIQKKREVPFEHAITENCEKDLRRAEDAEKLTEDQEFWKYLKEEMTDWGDGDLELTDVEKRVLHAVKVLFENVEELEIITKKSVYLYLREITGLPTKKIVAVLVKLRKKYFFFKRSWRNENY